MKHKFIPMFDSVLVLPDQVKDGYKTESGIVLPNDPKKNSNSGIVLAVGPNVKNVKVGDEVIFKRFAFDVIDTDDGKLIMVKEKDIIATII